MTKENIRFALGLLILFAVVFSITWYVQYRTVEIDREANPELYRDTGEKMMATYFKGVCHEFLLSVDDTAPITQYIVDKVNSCYEDAMKKK